MKVFAPAVLLLCTALSGAVFGDSSLNVPTGHWSYEAMEKFAIWGFVDMSGFGKKPLSRMQMARKIAAVIDKTQGDNFDYLSQGTVAIDTLEELLERLIKEYRQELVELGVGLGEDDEEPGSRFFRFSTDLKLQKAVANLDTAENIPENRQGWHLKDGFNLRGALDSRLRVRDIVGFELTPGVRKSREDADITLEKGYLRFSLYNANIQIGRDSSSWGPGYHGSMLLSDNAFPFDSLRLTNDRPMSLPWFLKKIGLIDIEYFITRLEEKRQTPNSYFLGFRVEINPFSWFNLGFSRTIIFGGRGAPKPSIDDYLQIFLPNHENKLGLLDNDQKISIDFRTRIPLVPAPLSLFAQALEIYGELAGEDDTTDITQLQPGHAINAGVFIPNLFNNRGLDVRFEFAQNDEVWYVHHIHGSYKYKNSLIGHHMGGDANDMFVRISKQLDNIIFGAQFSRENSGLSLSYTQTQTKNEIRADITLFHTADTTLSGLWEFEDIDNLENISGKTARNHIFLLEANRRF